MRTMLCIILVFVSVIFVAGLPVSIAQDRCRASAAIVLIVLPSAQVEDGLIEKTFDSCFARGVDLFRNAGITFHVSGGFTLQMKFLGRAATFGMQFRKHGIRSLVEREFNNVTTVEIVHLEG
ncbi:MAG TPA: hypothetical protein VIS48_08415 [Candidatus Kryptonia bacterium]